MPRRSHLWSSCTAHRPPRRLKSMVSSSCTESYRDTITRPDGRPSISLRALVQMDAAHYDQSAAGTQATDFRRGSVGAPPNRETDAARDLSDGAFFRRARIGIEGIVNRVFSYRFITEFGGAGTEGPA